MDAHPNEFRAIIAALDEAIEFVNQNPTEAKEYMRKYVPAQFSNHVTLYPDALYLKSTDTMKDIFQKEADAELKTGIISKPLDIGNLVYNAKQ